MTCLLQIILKTTVTNSYPVAAVQEILMVVAMGHIFVFAGVT